MPLSSLQEEVVQLFFSLPGTEGFAVAGGAALLLSGFDHRVTRDLDFFTPHEHDVPVIVDRLKDALGRQGLRVEEIRRSPHAARLIVRGGDESLEVDVARDYRMEEAVARGRARVLSLRELAADKVLALFGRAEPRDFHDVFALSRRFGPQELIELARRKDPVFDLYSFATSLARLPKLRRSEFTMSDGEYAAMLRYFRDWRCRILHDCGPQEA